MSVAPREPCGNPDITFLFPAKDEEKTIGEVVEKAMRAAPSE